jgi:hypothetical protein
LIQGIYTSSVQLIIISDGLYQNIPAVNSLTDPAKETAIQGHWNSYFGKDAVQPMGRPSL